jgi:hypothetical protein
MSSNIPPLPIAKSETEAAVTHQKATTFNPANAGGVAAEPVRRRRIPLSIPRRRLEVDPLPGFVLYWFKESNIPIAIEAGYEFVEQNEVRLSEVNQANPADSSGSTDLGSRVSLIGDAIGQRGVPERLVLMKIREEFWREDRTVLDHENAKVIQSIFGGQIVARDQGDHSQSYVNTSIAHGSGRLLNRGLKKQT